MPTGGLLLPLSRLVPFEGSAAPVPTPVRTLWGVPWSDAFGAIFTALAVVVALAVAGLEWRRSSGERRAREAWELRRQASHVAAWEVGESIYEEPWDRVADGPPPVVGCQRTIHVQNTSDQPVFHVVVAYRWTEREAKPQEWELPVLLPGQPATSWAPGLVNEADGTALLRVGFRDAAGYGWERTRSGVLLRRADQDQLPS
ncbi:MAG: hypothetical protein J0I40_11150 [Cellulomonas sp.]|uniref:hypothetical protein n=1 Tax=Cellulomonas sp. 73-92 TaxID=1895740 RepID=UPI00092AF531|nr:hypothetical protein [Cellulomonas sp. 73-92]MBN9375920.1 hypothetical protein [Cellulomonas sp.]OJV75962.1 MAG: hypothetical protein BGO37_06920 [Cellulomonas sp. 73-92]